MALYVVTGGAGFIGSNLVESLLLLGHTVHVIDNLSGGKREFMLKTYPRTLGGLKRRLHKSLKRY